MQPKSPAQGLVFAPRHKCILPAGGRAAGLYQYAVTCLGFQTDSAQEKLLKQFCVVFFFLNEAGFDPLSGGITQDACTQSSIPVQHLSLFLYPLASCLVTGFQGFKSPLFIKHQHHVEQRAGVSRVSAAKPEQTPSRVRPQKASPGQKAAVQGLIHACRQV